MASIDPNAHYQSVARLCAPLYNVMVRLDGSSAAAVRRGCNHVQWRAVSSMYAAPIHTALRDEGLIRDIVVEYCDMSVIHRVGRNDLVIGE